MLEEFSQPSDRPERINSDRSRDEKQVNVYGGRETSRAKEKACEKISEPNNHVTHTILFPPKPPTPPLNFPIQLDNRRPAFLAGHFSKMGRLHSKGKGISSSAIPYSRTPPAWLKTTPEQVVDHICKLAKKGATPSQIGVVLRDSHGVAQVKIVTGMEFSQPRLLCSANGRGKC